MAIVTLKELIEAGVHFGSAAARLTPKMKPFIHSKQAKIHIIDLRETIKGLARAWHFLKGVAAGGKRVLFVGTKRQAADVVRQEAARAEAHFVANRWLGGTLTNMDTMRRRIQRLLELESLESGGQLEQFNKKMIASLTRERKKIFRNFEGIRDMHELPGAIVVVDPGAEHICVAEANKLGIPLVGIIDTDDNPDPLDFVVPANDDAVRSVHCLVSRLADAALEGRKAAALAGVMKAREAASGGGGAAAAGAGAPGAAAAPKAAPAAPAVPEDLTAAGGFSYGGTDE
jgi:small subunit ribosomal protein S2